MAGRSRLNAKTLEALGAARLADLLTTLSEGDAGAKMLLRLALAEQKGAGGDRRGDGHRPEACGAGFAQPALQEIGRAHV